MRLAYPLALALAAAGLAAPPAAAQAPPLGKAVQVEFTGKEPGMTGVPGLDLSAYKVKEYEYAIEPGDRLRVELEAVGGVEMGFWVFAFKDGPDGFVFWEMMKDEQKAKVDWSMAKAPPGKRVKVFVGCTDLGKVNVRVSKVGAATDDPRDAKIKKLEDENAALRKELAEMRKQLDDIKRLLEAKKK